MLLSIAENNKKFKGFHDLQQKIFTVYLHKNKKSSSFYSNE